VFDGTQPCAKTDPDIFFEQEVWIDIEHTKWRYQFQYEREAKTLCSTCTFRTECLQIALDEPELQGIWGGTTPRERLALRRRSA